MGPLQSQKIKFLKFQIHCLRIIPAHYWRIMHNITGNLESFIKLQGQHNCRVLSQENPPPSNPPTRGDITPPPPPGPLLSSFLRKHWIYEVYQALKLY